MPTTPAPGSPSLIDVQSGDPAASQAFYTELFGWEPDTSLDPTGSYVYARLGDEVVAGFRASPPGQPAAWTLYLATDDIAGTAEQATALGGQRLHGPVEQPGQGHVLLVADPAGAVVGFWQPTVPWPFRSGQPGSFAWAELTTPDGTTADAYYAKLLGLTPQQIGDGQAYDYTVWTPAGAGAPVVGRLATTLPDRVPPHWLVYLAVDPATGTDATVDRAVRLGATVQRPPHDIPAGRTAVLTDPTGATVALIDGSRRATPR